jgi:hypothetical protein
VAAHLESLTDTLGADADEVRRIWLPMLGPVGGVRTALALWKDMQDDLHRLWRLIAADWDSSDLDPLPDRPGNDNLLVAQAEAIRFLSTANRLMADVEQSVWAARYRAAEKDARVA